MQQSALEKQKSRLSLISTLCDTKMMSELIIPGGDVLVATTVFLLQRRLIPYQFSVAVGREINSADTANLLREVFTSAGQPSPSFTGSGADILAVSQQEWWAIECKGSGGGRPQTQRNNFDRALASVVSYYEEQPQNVPERLANARVFLGLALPATKAYLKELERRVRKPLRKRLNLWILLYDLDSKAIRAVRPDDDF